MSQNILMTLPVLGLQGRTESAALLIFVNALAFIFTNVCCMAFTVYVIMTVHNKSVFSTPVLYIIGTAAILDTIWVIIGCVNGKLFVIDENRTFLYGEWHDYISIIPMIGIGFLFISFFKEIISLGYKKAIALSTYFFFPMFIGIWLMFRPDEDFSYVASAFSCFIIYIFIQNDALTDARIREQVTENANRAKSEFLARMSHEIRTPITAVLGMDEMILRESSEGAVRDYAFDIKAAGRNLLNIVNDILDLSKIESGKMEIVPADYDTASLFYDVYNMAKVRAESKNLSLEISVDRSIPARLRGDDIRIRQILTNLLSNAVKYTRKGYVWFRANVVESSADSAGKEVVIRFEVEDTGRGIKPEDMEKLFKKFERIDNEKNRGIEGTGLGMSITFELLKLMGSELKVESEYEKGSVFSFELRQKVVDGSPVGDFETRVKKQAVSEYSYHEIFTAPTAQILIVDDTDMNLRLFRALLKKTKVIITDAGSGREAVDLASKNKYDLILMDHMMPGMDGIEAMKAIKAIPGGPNENTPFIALTANAVVGAKEQYLAEGFNGFISKPVDSDLLEYTIMVTLPKEKITAING